VAERGVAGKTFLKLHMDSNPDPYWESRSWGKKIKKFPWKNALFSYFQKNFTTKKVK
jgi:hypothetical protein